ncbi:magnesium-transporting ATPase, P-type 1 [Methanobrevibacter cuticularis]|uniref:Magnesium-transporting ATPase, P-type 1 n=1 Tax=Methanobrevibacter cuticularis TaxID=47311 RepID=A0A166CZA1_9EURY|nr:magnesium-translocating P-type ATPase [Methanobrevibacter cuticularis]KZX15026.1 magnesium-transporting ATPase, P-type 1 [Methanobrevibacter cuticularis]
MDDEKNPKFPFWTLEWKDALKENNSSLKGLTSEQVSQKREKFGLNSLKESKHQSKLFLYLNQFKNPITLILLFAAILSYFLQDSSNAIIIIAIILFSTFLGFWQEKSAGDAVLKLLNLIQITATVLRDSKKIELPVEEIVPGDIIFLSAGNIIPADCLLVKENELFIDESTFTGETFPVEKRVTVMSKDTPLSKRKNSLFMGSHVVSGTCTALVIVTGKDTQFGDISSKLGTSSPPTDFEIGTKKFGELLIQITFIMVVFLFAVNTFLQKPVLESLLFTLAIAVGLTPQLLPAIISVNLSQGAKRMAEKRVIVKRLNSIENFGNMEILCSDKTGTLTKGKIKIKNTYDYLGNESKDVLLMAKMNSTLQQGFRNPIDDAINAMKIEGFGEYERISEIPYDFIRKRLTLLINDRKTKSSNQAITKGAVSQIIKICNRAIDKDGKIITIEKARDQINRFYEKLSSEGYRTLAIAYKDFGNISKISKDDEKDMIFAGFIALFDPPKKNIAETIAKLQKLKVELKIITGDNALIAKNISNQIGIKDINVVTGDEIKTMSDTAFSRKVIDVDIFAEVEPNQKEHIISTLKKAGKVVGYIGDGINDVSSIHESDVGLSVNTAVDVAKESADIVLLDNSLDVLIEGVKEGRRTFANTQKYIFMATSANFGNMFSMAGASMFLSFLPLLPKQILLTNLLTDIPSMAISSDNVDSEMIQRPLGWNLKFIKRFMIMFGVLSSVFDYITFGVLLFLFHAVEVEFQTGWFIESVMSATLIVLVIRTRNTFIKSKPSKYLLIGSIIVALSVTIFPFMPFASLLGFAPLPLIFYPILIIIVILYIVSAELTKKLFYKHLRSSM